MPSHSPEVCDLIQEVVADTNVCVCVWISQYESSSLGLISSRLRTTLNRIQESLIDMVRLQYTVSSLSCFLFFLLYNCSLPHCRAHFLTQTCSLLYGLPHFYSFNAPPTPTPPSHPPYSLSPPRSYAWPYCRESPQLMLPPNTLRVVIRWPPVTHTHIPSSL